MKILIEIKDSKANFFLELLKNFNFIKSQKILNENSYNSDFEKKIAKGESDLANGEGVTLSLDELDNLCK